MKRLPIFLLTLLALAAQAQQFPPAAHLRAVAKRTGLFMQPGMYLQNSPPEYAQMLAKRATFLADPVRQGTHSTRDSDNQPLQIWLGYTGTKLDSTPPPGVGEQYPLYEGEGAKAAITYTHLTGDTVGVGAVRRNLWRQATLGTVTGFRGHRASDWPTPPLTNNGSRKPNSFSASVEAAFIKNYIQTLALARPYMSAGVYQACQTYAQGWAYYLRNVILARFTSGPNGGDIPGYRSLNLTTRRGIYADGFPTDKERAWYTADGQAGPELTGAGYVFTNVYCNYLGAMAAYAMLAGDTAIYRDCRAYVHAMLFFSYYPDGVTHEAARNGDYGVGREVWYLAKCLENVLEAELMLRQRGWTITDLATTGGTTHTRCTAGQPAKTVRMAVDRLLTYYTASQLRYWTPTPSQATRIVSPYVGPPASRFGDDFETSAPSIFGMAAACFQDTALYLAATRHRLPGQAALPAKGYSSARGIQRFFNGRDNQIQPGIYSVWSGIDTRPFYSTMQIQGGGTYPQGTLSVSLKANMAGATGYTWQVPTTLWASRLQGPQITVQHPRNVAMLPGTYNITCTATTPTGRVTRTVQVVVSP